MKREKKKHNKKKLKNEIPDEIKILFGKFYVYSLIIILILVFFPFILNSTSIEFSIFIFLVLICFYLSILKNIFKKKEKFTSILFVFMMFLTFLLFSIVLLKIFSLT